MSFAHDIIAMISRLRKTHRGRNGESMSLEEKHGKTEWGRRVKQIAQGVIFALIPVFLFYLMEFYEHNPFVEVRSKAQFFNILLFELFMWALFFLSGSAKLSVRVTAALSMAFGLINHYVMEFRSTPFVPWDIFSIKTAAGVAGNYDFAPGVRVSVVTVLFILVIILARFLDLKWKKKLLIRLPVAAVGVAALCFFSGLLQSESFQTANYLYPYLFTPAYMTKVNGMAVTFVMDMAYVYVDKPQGYSVEECEELLASYQTAAERGECLDESDYPNIIVIMDEAFSDLAVLGEVAASEDYMPFVHLLQQGAENTITGYLNVSVCGGNTANTEFEFLTGDTMAFLPAGSIPYQQYIKGEIPSLTSHLSELDYATYAMHPYNASGWNRDEVYPWMGFEESYFLGDLSGLEYVRSYVSDASDFSKVIEIYENKPKDQPAFIFNVTMQNHGSYTTVYDNFAADISVDGVDSVALAQYLSLVRLTDEALEELVAYFDNQEEKTIIVFFGDHQPNNAVAKYISTDETEEKDRYVVPYVIWANYDIEESTGVETSVNYLAAHVLRAAGVPTSAYQNFLLELEQYYPVYSAVYSECVEENEELLTDYQKLQYYQLFDWEGAVE